MKILFFTDIHIGKKHANSYYLDLDYKVLDEILKTVKDEKIDKVIFGGDMMHNRGESSQKSLNVARIHLDKLNNLNIPIIMILGNHDIYYNSSKEYNYFKNWDGLYDNIKFVYDIEEDGEMLYVGWLQTKEEIKKYNELSNNFKYIFGHFEFKNVRITDNYISKIGYENDNLTSFIFSGHYHQRYIDRKLHYVGSPYPHDWHGKNNTQYGFCVLNTDNDSIEYKDLNIMAYFEFSLSEYLSFNEDDLKIKIPGNEIRLIIDEDMSELKLNEVKSQIYSYKPKNLLIESNLTFETITDVDNSKILINSPGEFIEEYINNMDMDNHRKKRILEKINGILK